MGSPVFMRIFTDYVDGSGLRLDVFHAHIERFKSRTGATEAEIEIVTDEEPGIVLRLRRRT